MNNTNNHSEKHNYSKKAIMTNVSGISKENSFISK